MATYGSDEEQIEALKRWWQDNGNSLLIGVAVLVLGIFSYRQWQAIENAYDAEASELYLQLSELVVIQPGEELSGEAREQALTLNQQLRHDYDSSVYARYSALHMAKLYVDAGELEQAEAELSWILDNPDLGFLESPDPSLMLIARLRLARVILSRGDAERALDMLSGAEDLGEYSAAYAEAEGDAYMALAQPEAAKSAYEQARDGGINNPILLLKLQNLESGEAAQ